MWQKFLEGLMGVLTFVSAPFITPEMPKDAITTTPEVIIETPVVNEEPTGSSAASESQEVNKDNAKTPAPTVVPKSIDPYCAKYASKYTQAEYNKEKKKPENIKKECEDDNKGESYKMNCEKMAEKHYKAFDDWEEQYDSYHARCR